MRIYVAAAREEIDAARGYMKGLRNHGHVVTHDWTADIDANGGDDTKVSYLELVRCALNDLHGVATADHFWLLCPGVGGSGCFVEFGYALARFERSRDGLPIPITVSGRLDRSLFVSIVKQAKGNLFESHEEAFMFLKGCP